MDCSIPGFPVHYQLPEFAQTHIHCVGDAIQPSHPQVNVPSKIWYIDKWSTVLWSYHQYSNICNIFHLKRYPPLIHQVILHTTTYIFSFFCKTPRKTYLNSLYWSLLSFFPEFPTNQALLHQNCSPSHQWPCCQFHWPILSPHFLELINSIWQINGLHLLGILPPFVSEIWHSYSPTSLFTLSQSFLLVLFPCPHF